MSILTKENQLKETKGSFEVRGKLFNVKSENAFKVNDKGNWRTVNLGLRISDSEVMYFKIAGGEKKEVYLSKRSEKKGEKPEVKKVDWSDRKKESRNGWQPMGVNIGLEKGEDGKNKIISLTEWDAYDYLKETLQDDMSVFVSGNIEYSTYTDKDNNVKKNQNFVAKKIYLATEEIDFQSANFEKLAGFAQTFVFLGGKEEKGQAFLDCGFVGFGSFENVMVETTKEMLDILRSKGMKKNWAVTFTGVLKTSTDVTEVKTDTWGEESKVGTNKTPAKTSLFVTGARGESLDKETYQQKYVDKYLSLLEEVAAERESKKNQFASQETGGSWGEGSSVKKEEEQDLPW